MTGRRNGKHLYFKGPAEDSMEQMADFMRLTVIRGVHYTVVLDELIREYNKKFRSENGLCGKTLAFEHELLKQLDGSCMPISRTRLGFHRSEGNLDGKHWADGTRVVYDVEGCKAFFTLRRAA